MNALMTALYKHIVEHGTDLTPRCGTRVEREACVRSRLGRLLGDLWAAQAHVAVCQH